MASSLDIADKLDKDGDLEITCSAGWDDEVTLWLSQDHFLTIAARFGFAVIRANVAQSDVA